MNANAPFPEESQDLLEQQIQQTRFKRALAYGVASILLATSGALAVRDRQLIREKKEADLANRLTVIPSRNRLTYRHL